MLKSKFINRWWRLLTLCMTAILGLAVRLYGLDWDSMLLRSQWMTKLYGAGSGTGTNFHPDERQIMYQVIKLSWPKNWAQFMDQASSPLNPHFFAYGTFPLYLLASLGNLFSHIAPVLSDFAHLTLVGRTINVLLDTGTILLTAWLALLLTPNPRPVLDGAPPDRSRAWSVALLAAACVAFTPFEVQQAHYYTVDIMTLFLVMLTIVGCVKLIQTENTVRWALLVGLGYGLGLATKTSTAPLLVPLLLALGLRWYQKRDLFDTIVALVYAGCTTLLVFAVAEPYAFLDLNEFRQQVGEQGDLARGLLDLPYVRQFAGTTPGVYELQNLVLWGMGVMLGVISLAGLLWLFWRLWKHELAHWLVPLSWVIVYGVINCTFYTKYMRYLLPIYPLLVLMGASMLIWLTTVNVEGWGRLWERIVRVGSYALIGLVLLGTIFQCLALVNIYSQPNTRLQASAWIFQHLKPGTMLTYEQWDDALPVVLDGRDPSIYPQATWQDAGGAMQTGLDLYGDDSVAKAKMIATVLMQVGAITMPTDRLDKSIPRWPARYPLTIRYYNLLFSGKLGFHLGAQFQVHPNFLGITLDDSDADESFTVFDHPNARIYVRDAHFPFTSVEQLQAYLLQGVTLPTATGSAPSGGQKSLLLSASQISSDQNSPSFAQQFPAGSAANNWPVFFWWLTITLLGLLAFPLAFLGLRGLSDRGYLFAKTLGLLLLGYLCWQLANIHLIAFSFFSALLASGLLALVALLLAIWLRRQLWAFLRERWRLLLIEECIFTSAFLAFVLIRSFNPDLWQAWYGGEKPMELAFLNAILRSPWMPPQDPWFSGGYINYYYFGYVIVASVIKLTGILPTTAFNLIIPTLFALTFTGAFSIIYSLSKRLPVALLGGYLVALLGNLDGAVQAIQQLGAWLHQLAVPSYSYWQSSRIIPFTINEYPYWSFLFADLHPHVIVMPFSILMLGLVASGLLAGRLQAAPGAEKRIAWYRLDRHMARLGERYSWEELLGRVLFYLLAGLVFGTIVCINPWDAPVVAILLGAGMAVHTFYQTRAETPRQRWLAMGKTGALYALALALGYLAYRPFYALYQQLDVSGISLADQHTSILDYLHVFGIWLFLCASFFCYELYRGWHLYAVARPASWLGVLWDFPRWLRIALYFLVWGSLLLSLSLLGTRPLLGGLFLLGLFLFFLHGIRSPQSRDEQSWSIRLRYAYLLILLGLGIGLGIEVVYVRDFLADSDYERMNTVFKFSMQLWLCLGLGCALAIAYLWQSLRGGFKYAWSVLLLLSLLSGSIFLVEGTLSRIDDHQNWANGQKPAQSANYTPTLDGFAFVSAWYPGDARAIAWLNAHVAGSPVVLEATSSSDYSWAGRVSVYTGLPTVLGWPGHENEQRSDQVANRQNDVGTIYTTDSVAQALTLLHQYHVRYIYVGDLERQMYAAQSSAGLDKFDAMVQQGLLQLAYRQSGVSIYAVTI